MNETTSMSQPNGYAEGPPANDAEQVNVPTKDDLRWPYVRALRELGGSADKNDVEERVSVLLELTTEQMAAAIPSGSNTKLQNRLDWAGHGLKDHGIVAYPSRGHRELTPLGTTITESQLDALLRRTDDIGSTADLGELIERFCDEEPYPTDDDKEQKQLREQWRTKLLPENIKDFRRTDLRGVWHNMLGGVADYIWPDSSELSDRIRGLSDLEYDQLIENIEYLCWNENEELWSRYHALKDANSRRKAPNNFADVTISKLLAICHPKRFLPIGAQDGSPGRLQMMQRLSLGNPQGSSHDQQVIHANDKLRDHLSPYFTMICLAWPDSSTGMARVFDARGP